MKYIFAVILTLPFSIHAMDSKKALINNLNGPMEQLKNISSQMEERNDVLNRTATKLDELLVMYASLIKQEQDEPIRQRLAYIQQNLIESIGMLKEMLEEKRQNKRFWFFGAGDQDSELATGEDGDNDSDSCESVSVTSDQIVDELRDALLTMHVTSSNKR